MTNSQFNQSVQSAIDAKLARFYEHSPLPNVPFWSQVDCIRMDAMIADPSRTLARANLYLCSIADDENYNSISRAFLLVEAARQSL